MFRFHALYVIMHYRGAIRLSCFAKLSKYNTWSHALKYTITIGTKCLSSTWTQNGFLGSELVLLFEDEMMRIGLNFWFFDKFASSLSITNCVKNKSQKVTKEMKTPKINNSCPQKNYVTIGLKCLMPSFEENHKNHHKNIWYIFFTSIYFQNWSDDLKTFCQVFPVDIWPRSYEIF